MKLFAILLETPAPGEVIIDDTWYSPGVVGFLATFGLAAASLLLFGTWFEGSDAFATALKLLNY